MFIFFFFKQKTAYEMRISDWSSDVCSSDLQFLIIHAAALEKSGRAAILPGAPGSGKSTLTAYLVHNGWRLLSDELALISLQHGREIGRVSCRARVCQYV